MDVRIVSELVPWTFAGFLWAWNIVRHCNAVTDSVDVWIARLQIFISVNAVSCGEANPGFFKSKVVNVGLPSSRKQDCLHFDVALHSFVRKWLNCDFKQRMLEARRLFDHLDFRNNCIKVEVAAILTKLRVKQLRSVAIFSRQQLTVGNERHLCAESLECLTKFRRNRTRTKDRKSFGLCPEIEDTVRCIIGYAILGFEAINFGHKRTTTCGNTSLVEC